MRKGNIFWSSEEEKKKEEPQQIEIYQAGPTTDDSNVTCEQNRIYFYSEVERTKNLKLNKYIRNLDFDLHNRTNILAASEIPPMFLHIQSYGGCVFSGFSSVDYIKRTKAPIYSIVEGCAASAATLMSVVADKRFMTEHSFMLIHQLSGGVWGTYEDIVDNKKNCDRLMKMIKNIYLEHTKIPKRKLDSILKTDIWLDAEQCLDYGLVDEII